MSAARAYYNEWEPYAAQWLRNLIAAGHIAPGEIDERSITDVQPDDLKGFTQCHFFAGIGGWSYALRLAGWPDDRPVWTGSCPCQPFSAAGTRRKQSDERHLWPHWYRLIRQQHPATVFGEQVDDAVAAGWLDDAFLDMESEAYACAAAVLPACGVGAPHKRDRLWFVAHRECERLPSGVFKCPQSAAIKPSQDNRGRFGYPVGPAWHGEPELAVLVHGLPSDVAVCSALGNAIVPQVAAEFIRAVM